MKLDLGKTDIRINISFAATVTLMLIIDESGICALALFCCILHEIGHIICLAVMGEAPSGIVLSFYGIKLERLPLAFHGRKKEILIFASGPLTNLLFAVIFFLLSAANEKLKVWAAVSLLIGVFNIIPVKPLDGGNILFSFLCGVTEKDKAENICGIVSAVIIAPMLFAGVLLSLRNGNFTLLATSAYLALNVLTDKNENECIKV